MLPFLYLGILLILLLGLPPFGPLLAGYSFPAHLSIFPIPTEPGESSISWFAWGMVAILITGTISPFIWRFFNFPIATKDEPIHSVGFPWWGWVAIGWMTGAWIVAWNRFTWFQSFQPHTFSLLWFGYIAILNALTYQRSGQCFLTHRPRFLGQLFLLSAGFWWLFEYLNQYVNNWHYVNVPTIFHFEYVFYTSISFSTVLPAVLSTYEWLSTFPRLTRPFENWPPLPWMIHQKTGWTLFGLGSMGLLVIGIWPTVLFPLLWLSPLCLLLGIQIFGKGHPSLQAVVQGDWRLIILSALASLLCGFWWELWNVYSLVHWEYTLPYVHAFKLFEMPILGYSGYLPFGMLCLAVTEVVLGYRTNRPPIMVHQRRQQNGP